jgi:hypothetical protein
MGAKLENQMSARRWLLSIKVVHPLIFVSFSKGDGIFTVLRALGLFER